MEKNPDDEEIEADINETVALIKEAYLVFNQVLAGGSLLDKSKATSMMNILGERLKDQIEEYDEAHEVPTKVLMDYTKDTDNESIKELQQKVGDIESVMKETEKLLEKNRPAKKKAKRKKSSGLKRKMKGMKIRRFKSKRTKAKKSGEE